MNTLSRRTRTLGVAAAALVLISVAPLHAQAPNLEGAKWRIDQEGVDTQVVWWFGSEGRVRTGDLGIILPAYKWRQSGDSVFVSVGDTMRYAALLMSNRLVGGIRSWRNHGEGWWSGERADVAAPAAVAAAPTSTPAGAPAGAQPMSRPADSAATPSSPAVTPPAGRRPLRQILRGEAAAPAGEGRQMRRIERAEAAQAAATPAGAPDPQMVGSWVRADSLGIVDGFDLLADGSAKLHLRGGREATGQWSSDPQESRVQFQGPEGQANVTLVIWTGGPGLRGALISPSGRGRTLAFQRAGDGPVRQPAIRQP